MYKNFLQHTLKLKQGFSLVEMLVYVAVLMLISAGSITLLLTLADNVERQQANQLVTRSAQSTLERMLKDIRGADAVDTFYSALETSPGVLVLTADATTTEYSLTGGQIMLEVDGTVLGPLTEENVTVEGVTFFRYDNSLTELVRVELTLSATVGESTVTETFNASATLRGSYE